MTTWKILPRVAAGWLTLFLVGTDLFVISPLLPVVSARYHVTAGTAGWTLTAFSLAYLLAAPFLGGLSDRHGRRLVIALGLAALSLANLGTSMASTWSPSFAVLLGTRVLAGFSAAAIAPSVYAATGDMVAPARRATWLAIVGSGLLIALTLGAPIGGVVAARSGMRTVFLALAGAGVLMSMVSAAVWPPGLMPAIGAPPQGAVPANAASPARATVPTVLWAAALFGGYTYFGVGLASRGATPAETGLVIALFGGGMVIGNLSGGWASDRFGARRVMIASYLGLGLGWLALASFVRVGLHGSTARMVALGFCFSLTSYLAQLFFPAQQARLAGLFAARRGAALAWNNSALYLGMSVGSAFGGLVLQRAGFPVLLTVLGVAALLSGIGSLVAGSVVRAAPAHATTAPMIAPVLWAAAPGEPEDTLVMATRPGACTADGASVDHALTPAQALEILERVDGSRSRSRWPSLVFAFAGVAAVSTVAVTGVVVARSRSALAAGGSDAERASAARVVVAPVEMLPAGRSLSLVGDVRPARQVTVYAKVSGYLQKINVDKGDAVKEGQILGLLETPDTDQQLVAAQAELGVRRRAATRARALAAREVISEAELERSDGDLTIAGASVSRYRALKGYATIRAPFAGTITARYADPGALLQAATGATGTALPLVDISDLSRARVTVYIGQNDAPYVSVGTPVVVWTNSEPRKRVPAAVTRTTRALDAVTRTLQVEIELPNTDGAFTAGDSVHVDLVAALPGGLAVPVEAVFVRQGKPSVMVAQNGHAELRAVETAHHDGKTVRVAAGLREGDIVILHGSSEVAPGAAIEAVRRDDKGGKR